jgi:hypothetical protein
MTPALRSELTRLQDAVGDSATIIDLAYNSGMLQGFISACLTGSADDTRDLLAALNAARTAFDARLREVSIIQPAPTLQ